MSLPITNFAISEHAAAQIPVKGKPVREAPGLDRIGVNEKLGQTIPLDVELTDHEGKTVILKELFQDDKPVLFTFAYHSCPVLCSLVLDSMLKSIQDVEWTAGKEYRVINISIDPTDSYTKAEAKRQQLLKKYDREPQGSTQAPAQYAKDWHFLVAGQDEITRLTQAFGFRYFYNSEAKQYAHPAVLMFLSPEGKIARYLYGLEYSPADVRLALLEASKGNTISTTERFLLYCYQYDPNSSSYSLMATRVMQVGGGMTAFFLAGALMVFWRRELKKRNKKHDMSGEQMYRQTSSFGGHE